MCQGKWAVLTSHYCTVNVYDCACVWDLDTKTAAAITPLIIPIVNQASSQCNTVKFDQDPDGRGEK